MTHRSQPQWVRDRIKMDEAMGPAPGMDEPVSETIGYSVGLMAVLAFRLAIFIGFCVVVYLIGRWIVT